jgi:hypothetical protein
MRAMWSKGIIVCPQHFKLTKHRCGRGEFRLSSAAHRVGFVCNPPPQRQVCQRWRTLLVFALAIELAGRQDRLAEVFGYQLEL